MYLFLLASSYSSSCVLLFFFQAEDGIRDLTVTGVQTCALPIWSARRAACRRRSQWRAPVARPFPPRSPCHGSYPVAPWRRVGTWPSPPRAPERSPRRGSLAYSPKGLRLSEHHPVAAPPRRSLRGAHEPRDTSPPAG